MGYTVQTSVVILRESKATHLRSLSGRIFLLSTDVKGTLHEPEAKLVDSCRDVCLPPSGSAGQREQTILTMVAAHL